MQAALQHALRCSERNRPWDTLRARLCCVAIRVSPLARGGPRAADRTNVAVRGSEAHLNRYGSSQSVPPKHHATPTARNTMITAGYITIDASNRRKHGCWPCFDMPMITRSTPTTKNTRPIAMSTKHFKHSEFPYRRFRTAADRHYRDFRLAAPTQEINFSSRDMACRRSPVR